MPEETKPEPKLTAGDIRKWMREEFTALVEGAQPKEKPESKKDDNTGKSGSIADEVKAELAKLEARRKRDERDKSIDDQLAEVKQAVQPKPPVERSRLHRFMGWGEND